MAEGIAEQKLYSHYDASQAINDVPVPIISAHRVASVERITKESHINIDFDIDGGGKAEISTGISFFDHMLTAFAVHGNFSLKVIAQGDYHVEAHHTVEDTAIVLGKAFAQAIGDKKGITRFGDSFIPMDETLVHAIVDISGRAYTVVTGEPEHMLHSVIHGDHPYATVINQHFFETFAAHAQINLHIRVLYGRDPHHITEAEYKALARALRIAVAYDGSNRIPSTKGTL